MTNDAQFRLSGAWNFRDVAGARTADGREVRPGVYYRASALSRLDEAGRAMVAELGITDVFDLRGRSEIEREGPDAVPESVEVHAVPFYDYEGEAAPHETPRATTEAERVEQIHQSYARFPTLPGTHHAVRSVLDALAQGRGAVLVHCAAGKDRAGWTTATVLRALGVVDEDVLADYLLSNGGIEPLREHVRRMLADSDRDFDVADLSDEILGVSENFFGIATDSMLETFGSFQGYLEAIGISADVLDAARKNVLT